MRVILFTEAVWLLKLSIVKIFGCEICYSVHVITYVYIYIYRVGLVTSLHALVELNVSGNVCFILNGEEHFVTCLQDLYERLSIT